MNHRRAIINRIQNSLFYCLYALVFVVFVYVTIWGDDGLIKLIELKNKKRTISATNYQLLKENLLLVEEIQKLKNAVYLEQKARSDLGMIRANETVYVVK